MVLNLVLSSGIRSALMQRSSSDWHILFAFANSSTTSAGLPQSNAIWSQSLGPNITLVKLVPYHVPVAGMPASHAISSTSLSTAIRRFFRMGASILILSDSRAVILHYVNALGAVV